jgi:glycosyltransferase involved in cell wall biosynthesis
MLGKDNIDAFTKQSTITLFKGLLSEKALKNVTFLKAVPYKEVITHIQKSEVVLLPSFAEAFPMTWLEAMALEKKLVTSNIGWAKELMIDGDTGFMINPINTNKFATKVLNLLKDKKKATSMAKEARKRIIDKFNLKQSIVKNIESYKLILK